MYRITIYILWLFFMAGVKMKSYVKLILPHHFRKFSSADTSTPFAYYYLRAAMTCRDRDATPSRVIGYLWLLKQWTRDCVENTLSSLMVVVCFFISNITEQFYCRLYSVKYFIINIKFIKFYYNYLQIKSAFYLLYKLLFTHILQIIISSIFKPISSVSMI